MGDVFVITGARGTGKTTLAATYLPPADTECVFWHDSERSANRIIQQMSEVSKGFGHYVNLASRFTDLPGDSDLLHSIEKGVLPWRTRKEQTNLEAVWDYIISDLNRNLAKDQYKVYVHDTIAKLEAAMVAWADAHTKVLGVRGSSKGSPWGEFWTAGVYELYDQLFEAVFARGVETIILTSHLKAFSEVGKQVPGKVTIGGKPWLTMQTSMVLWLVNEDRNADGAPAGLVLKERLGTLGIDGDEWKPRRMLPRRIPHCTWADIRRYLKDGCDLADPAEGESLSRGEAEMISPLLTNEQMRLMVLGAEVDLELLRRETAPVVEAQAEPLNVGEEGSGAGQDPQERARALAAEGMTAADIAHELGKPLPLVRKWIE